MILSGMPFWGRAADLSSETELLQIEALGRRHGQACEQSVAPSIIGDALDKKPPDSDIRPPERTIRIRSNWLKWLCLLIDEVMRLHLKMTLSVTSHSWEDPNGFVIILIPFGL